MNNKTQEIPIILGNAEFIVKRKEVAIKDLKLDPNNQRISHLIALGKIASTDLELHKTLWDLDSVKELYQSIYQNGGLIEDPIVHNDYTVIEGNCRTVALRELRRKYPHNPRFNKVYVRILPQNVTEEQLMLLIGELHIAGKIEWRPYEQAEYVWKMNKKFNKPYDYLASHLRWSRSKLTQKINAYEETKKYIETFDDPQGINRFSFFEELMKKGELREKREQDSDFMKEFSTWIFTKKFTEAKDVRILPEIMNNPDAFQKLKNEGIKEARLILYNKNPSLNSNLYSVIDNAIHELSTISLREIQDIKARQSSKVDKVKNLKNAIQTLEDYVGFKF